MLLAAGISGVLKNAKSNHTNALINVLIYLFLIYVVQYLYSDKSSMVLKHYMQLIIISLELLWLNNLSVDM